MISTTAKLVLAVVCCAATQAVAADINGAGSSAAQPLYVKWAEQYARNGGVGLSYQAIGSSGGLAKIRARGVDFGASDVALTALERERDKLVCFPSAISGVVPVVNLPGVASGDLQLSGEVLAQIFAHKITRWNDPALLALNPKLNLPKLDITLVVRLDGSGTTYNFTDYLSKVSAEWKQTYGRNFTIAWPAEASQIKGSGGVVAALKKTSGAISYVDYHYVLQDKLSYARLRNRDGKVVAPSSSAFAAALANSSWKKEARFEDMLTDQTGPRSWPITMGTFVIVPQESAQPAATIAALKFFVWGFLYGDELVSGADFVRLPENVQGRIYGELTKVRDTKGQPLDWSLVSLLKFGP